MAFEKIFDFIDEIAKEHKNAKNTHDKFIYIMVLITYLNTVLETSKFKAQRSYCKKVIRDLNPHFADGYFNSKSTKKPPKKDESIPNNI